MRRGEIVEMHGSIHERAPQQPGEGKKRPGVGYPYYGQSIPGQQVVNTLHHGTRIEYMFQHIERGNHVKTAGLQAKIFKVGGVRCNVRILFATVSDGIGGGVNPGGLPF